MDKHIGEQGWRDRLPAGDEPVPIVPRWRDAAQVATVGIFIILFVIALDLARPIALPTAAAFVVTMMLSPLSERAERYRIPSLVTAVVLWLLVLAIFYAVIMLVSSPVVEWAKRAPDSATAFSRNWRCSTSRSAPCAPCAIRFFRPIAARRSISTSSPCCSRRFPS